MKVALVCIAKNEDFYLHEWIEYNKKLGFDHIFIYENDWKSNIVDPMVTTIPFNGKIKQLPAYNHFIFTNKKNFDYAAIFDCDEFLVLKKHKTIQDFLTEYQPINGIGINWIFYGSDGKEYRKENSLLKQFTKRHNKVNIHVKSIINLKSENYMTNPHNPNNPLIDTNRKEFTGSFNVNGDGDVAVINHYYLKTYEDWTLRCKRGRADMNGTQTLDMWTSTKYVDIEVEDLTALNFLYNT